MPINWIFTLPVDSEYDQCTTTTSALTDLVPSFLAYLDYDALQRLSSVNRAAARSPVRVTMLEQSVLQLSPTSIVVHDTLRNMALRSHLHAFEIRDCLSPPHGIRDLPQLLASARRIKLANEPKLDQEVLDEVNRKGQASVARRLGHTAFVRHVRQRLNEEHRYSFPREFPEGSPLVAQELEPWFIALNPLTTVEFDFGKLLIDNFWWIRRFSNIKKLHFDASSDFSHSNYLVPLAQATSLEELVITRLELPDCSQLGALESLKILELRCAPRLRNIDFMRNLINLERVVMTEVPILKNISPLLNLTALRDLTLDSIGSLSSVKFGEESQVPTPAFPNLESLQVIFTRISIDRFLHQCPKLKQLHLCNSRLDTWKPLRSLQSLEQISINVDEIEDWTPLAELNNLKRLALDSNHGLVRSRPFVNCLRSLSVVISPPWDDYTPLVEGAPALKELHLLGWRERDSSTLASLKNATCLRTLRIAFTPGAVELSTVGELHQLQSLELWNASTVTIEFLRGMQNLVELNVSTPFGAAVNIISFTPLGFLKALQTLILTGRREFKNANLDILTQLPRLRNLDVSDSGVTPSFLKKLRSQYNTQRLKFTSQDDQAHRTRLADMVYPSASI